MSSAEENQTIQDAQVQDMYKVGSDIVNNAISTVAAACVAGAKIIDLCTLGDSTANASLASVFAKGKVEKRLAFPTCVSANHVAGNFSPSLEDNGGSDSSLSDGDVVKIDCAVLIGGWVSALAHTVVVGAQGASEPVTGKRADVIAAAHTAAEAALRVMTPGSTNTRVTEVIGKVAEEFGCRPVQGVLSHVTKKFVPDGNRVIAGTADPEHRVEEFEFEPYEVYHLDICMSTGEGKIREKDSRITVYKRMIDQTFNLRMKASRSLLAEVSNRFSHSAFTMRELPEARHRLGVSECVKHGLLAEYPVLEEKPGEIVAQFKYTVMIKPNGIVRTTGLTAPHVKSEHEVKDEEIISLLRTSIAPKKKKNKKKKAAASMETD